MSLVSTVPPYIKHAQNKANHCQQSNHKFLIQRILDHDVAHHYLSVTERRNKWTVGVLTAAVYAAVASEKRFRVKRMTDGYLRIRFYQSRSEDSPKWTVTWILQLMNGYGYVLKETTSLGRPARLYVFNTTFKLCAANAATKIFNYLMEFEIKCHELYQVELELTRMNLTSKFKSRYPPFTSVQPDNIQSAFQTALKTIYSTFADVFKTSNRAEIEIEITNHGETVSGFHLSEIWNHESKQNEVLKLQKTTVRTPDFYFEFYLFIGPNVKAWYPSTSTTVDNYCWYMMTKGDGENNLIDKQVFFDKHFSLEDNLLYAFMCHLIL